MNNSPTQNQSIPPEANQSSEPTEAYKATQYLLRRIVPPTTYYKLRTFSRQYPILFLPFARWRWERWRQKYCPDTTGVEPAAPQPLTKDTEIVIEAYPRSGNTFAHVAFKFAQTKPVKIGHHTHAAANVIAGVKNKIPTVVIIRNPKDAVISYLIGDFDPQLSMKQAISEYISFYGPIMPYKQGLIVATFEELTTDYGAVISKVNQKFQTNFDEFDHTEANVKRCFDLIDEGYQKTFGDLSEKVVSRPSAMRENLKQKLSEDFQSEQLALVRAKADKIYETLTNK